MTHTHLRKYLSRRMRGARLLVIMSVFIVGYLSSLGVAVYTFLSEPETYTGDVTDRGGGGVEFPEVKLEAPEVQVVRVGCSSHSQLLNPVHIGRRLLSNGSSSDASYPPEIFSMEQKKNGAVVLHVFGMIYMFIALAIVCDEFFVPSLGVITEKLDISEDVSGATFMAAGGSAPELFTSIIGVFIAKNDVGIGTIVGSAVFNILFVIGMCALFSKEVLKLTWWPLFRDVTFYSISLVALIYFFSNDYIEWWEALILFFCYISYVTFMKFNQKVEVRVKALLQRCKCSGNKVNSSDHLLNGRGPRERSGSMPYIHSGSGHYRHGMVQLMIHTIDPLAEAKAHDKAVQLQATLQVIANGEGERGAQNNNNGTTRTETDNNMQVKVISSGKVQENGSVDNCTSPSLVTSSVDNDQDNSSKVTSRDVTMSVNSPQKTSENQITVEENPNTLEEEEEPLDMSWPDTWRKRISYVLLAPLVFPMWFTLPDVRRPDRRKFFPVTFIGSILWIAGFSYCMVWWANVTGVTIGIPDEVMGLTILAAGTSIPDLITSVIVAKKGFGDMAVSSSVGSNIFDITVGLPLPWLLYSAVNGGDAYRVSSDGLLCSIVLLFVMLVAVVISIAASGWRMSKLLGVAMMVLYLVFVTLAVLLEYGTIECFA